MAPILFNIDDLGMSNNKPIESMEVMKIRKIFALGYVIFKRNQKRNERT